MTAFVKMWVIVAALFVTMKVIAAQAGVTQATVSMCLANNPRIPPPTRERIRAIAPDSAAKRSSSWAWVRSADASPGSLKPSTCGSSGCGATRRPAAALRMRCIP